jgi:two-component system sensor histidine kinase/response regulator
VISTKSEPRLLVALSLLAVLAGTYWFKNKTDPRTPMRVGRNVADGPLPGGSTFMDAIAHRKPGVPIDIASTRRAARSAWSNFFFLLLAGAVPIAGVVRLRRLRAARRAAVAVMSHEIRTPMNGAIALTGLPSDTPLTGPQELAGVHESGVALRPIAVFSPRKLLEDVAAMQAGRAHQKGLEVGFFVDPKTPREILGDAGALRHVLLNLLNSALKFTERGSVVMRVEPVRIEAEKVWLQFTVSDTGSGAGLGLTICKRLVDLTDGQIEITSSAGKGSVVRFTAPFEVAAAGEPSPEGGAFQGMRVRVQCETEIAREMLVELLTSLGVTACWDDDAGLDCEASILEQGDIGGGRLQSTAARLGAPPILLTSIGNHARLDDIRAAGISEVLFKPVRAARLAACLSRISSSAQSPAQSGPERRLATKPRVLVAEDNRVNQKVARKLLQKMGYEVEMVGTGREAVEAAGKGRYDAILMDCGMPDMDGYDATREIRRLYQECQRPPVIAMTAGATPADKERCRMAGMDDYLTKPVNVEQLRKTLQRWI